MGHVIETKQERDQKDSACIGILSVRKHIEIDYLSGVTTTTNNNNNNNDARAIGDGIFVFGMCF
jgi:hypothetical protein